MEGYSAGTMYDTLEIILEFGFRTPFDARGNMVVRPLAWHAINLFFANLRHSPSLQPLSVAPMLLATLVSQVAIKNCPGYSSTVAVSQRMREVWARRECLYSKK